VIELTANIFGPLNILFDFFGYAAGIVLLMIGIVRLTKNVQEGPRGPGGIGTIMTFAAGAALLSFSPMISAFSVSLFDVPTTKTFGNLTYTAGLTAAWLDQANAIISAVVKLLIVLGLGIFLRGIFICRGAVQGHGQQASFMAGVAHVIAGALAVNIGPLVNAAQNTLAVAGSATFN
jgi:hypothetical protein